ncbi:MAG TPA: hemolysin III family protein [Acidimicrobiia bacterium]
MEEARLKLGRMENPVRGFLHGTAAVAALVATIALMLRATTVTGMLAGLVFGIGLVAVYVTSSLYHSIPWGPRNKVRMQRADHAMIFVLIAGTYTPVAAALGGRLALLTLLVAWSIAITGILQHLAFPRHDQRLSIALATTMGWLAVAILWPMAQAGGPAAVILIAVGGVFYTVGMVFMVTRRPRLWPRVFSAHELFHVFVIVGSTCHFAANYRYFLPLA